MSAAPPPPPPGLNYIAVITPVMHSILIGHAFLVLFLPLMFMLWFFSTKYTRRQPVYILNVINICLAIAVGIMIDWRGVRLTLDPLTIYPVSFNLSISILGVIQSLLIDTILLIRLVSVYPRDLIGVQRFVLLITLPVLLKIGRFINLVIMSKVLTDLSTGPNAQALLLTKWAHAPYIKIEWFGQLIDVTYASTLFLYKIWLHRKGRENIESGDSGSKVSFGYRLKVMFYIAGTNFVLPVIFSLVQIIALFTLTDQETTNDIVLVNTNLSVIGVVFASIWAGAWARGEEVGSGAGVMRFPGSGPTLTAGSNSMHFAVRSVLPNHTVMTAASGLSSTHGATTDGNASVPMFIIAEKPSADGSDAEKGESDVR
ncbi:hypothetical protein EW146_g6823 [Bondarzewia mesenterica]|uniref:G-protein coupled receptors family 1 profile domain-containing protein n=1 Tax=Bondarzewia mesenterica TaxID=1095465 RepID=A0A4S4LMF0_9AGAM|nr:hypothetical protein EW146_g6823 [Bondarzewia mesenterica]